MWLSSISYLCFSFSLLLVDHTVWNWCDIEQVDRIRAEDKGYAADIVVVTYNSGKIPKNGNFKFRILLVSA